MIRNSRLSFFSFSALLLALLFLFAACAGEGKDPADAPAADESSADAGPEAALRIVENGTSTFAVVRADLASDAIVKSAINLKGKIVSYTAVEKIGIQSDYRAPKDAAADFPGYEILVGETNRPESQEVLASLPENSYTVTLRNNKLVILGTDDNLTVLALHLFEDTVLKNSDRCGSGFLTVTEKDCQTVTLDHAFALSDMLGGKYPITARTKQLFQCPKYNGSIRIAQGAASDGTYVYFVIRHTNDENGAVVYKHRLDDGTRVAESEVLHLGHGNDAAFDTKNNRLVVAHGQSQGKKLTLIDPETLAVIETIDIPAGAGAISYSAATDRYAISQGGSTLHILDSDFKLISSFSRAKNKDYTAQGMGSDEEYVYFPKSGSVDNIIEVYTWNGVYVTTIHVSDSYESESLFWVNGNYYIVYYKGASDAGAYLHQLNFWITYE